MILQFQSGHGVRFPERREQQIDKYMTSPSFSHFVLEVDVNHSHQSVADERTRKWVINIHLVGKKNEKEERKPTCGVLARLFGSPERTIWAKLVHAVHLSTY
jgi:hypothetical protein